MNWSIIIFCYNERGNLSGVIERTHAFLQNRADVQAYEIILVDDGSNDGSEQVMDEALALYPNLKLVRHPQNKGIGFALRSGYDTARYEYVCAIPADGQFNVEELQQVLPFSDGQFVSFFRREHAYNLYRKFLTYSNRLFNGLVFGMWLKDVNWIKVYKKAQLEFSAYRLTSSIVESEITAKLIKTGCRPVELPSVYQERAYGKSKGGSWKTLKKAIVEMGTLYREVRRFHK